MNILAWLAGALAAFWMAVYAFDTLDDTAIGVAMIGLFLMCLAFIISGAVHDVSIFVKGRGNADEE